ncbi:PTS transporter subunit EIIC [Clostridium sp. YIM B02506]|uniref:PTS transporter subunit EIIC n=1 Tax=Clostridium sp. YIM B02506 TaxID=2910680 RepID=UPI001EED6FDF|nr:PTS transporter subunit EIIC [Clostridium sp. YIM B02506]
MSKKYESLAKDILKYVGGKENVNHVMNCATRLRFQLKDIEKADKEKIMSLQGVITVVIQSGQFQVCIGSHVSEVAEEVNKLGDFSDSDKKDTVEKPVLDRFFEVVSGIFTPIVPVLIAAGMVGGILALLSGLNLVSTQNPTYYTFNIIREAGFYFLPILVGYTAAKKLDANPFLSMMLGSILVHPQLSNFSALGVDNLDIFGLAVPNVKYSASVLPIILGVWLLSYVEKFFKKIFHPVVRSFMAPMMTMLVMLPIMLLIIGPAGNYVATYLGQFVVFFGDKAGFIAVALLAAFMPIMIVTGTHSFAFPVIVATITATGSEALLVPAMMAENLAMAGAALAVSTIVKNQDKKAEARAASLSAVLGISEPAMYGVNLPLKTPFYAVIIGGGIGGLFAGIFKLKFYAIVSASLVGLPGTLDGQGFTNLIVAIGTMIISFVAAFIATKVLSKNSAIENTLVKEEVKA